MLKLKKLWNKIEESSIGTKKYFFLTPAHYSLYCVILPILKKYVKGSTLDLGAGRLCWKPLLEQFSSLYLACDIKIEKKFLNFVSDGQIISVKDEILDTVICFQVLEHTKEPRSVLMEICRILKVNGIAIVSFPHLSYLHGEPEDYFRWTIYGFKNLLPFPLKMEEFCEIGGFICFITTPFFIFINSIFSCIPLLRCFVCGICSLLSKLLYHIDRILGLKELFPLNYVVILKKNEGRN